jgi:pyruvate dehydrogenase E2 component (dihydrolipoamide acetyltransferase)
MPYEVVMPAMEMDQSSATLVKWLKLVGAPVTEGEPLMEIETDKVTVEIDAPRSGILDSVTAQPGDEVPVGTVIALIRGPGEQAQSAATTAEATSEGERARGAVDG